MAEAGASMRALGFSSLSACLAPSRKFIQLFFVTEEMNMRTQWNPGKSMLVVMAIAALWGASGHSRAAPVQGPTGTMFYSPPSTLSGAHGDLIWYRTANVDLGDGAPAVSAWNVLYNSQDSLGAANAVTGTVMVPKKAWSGSGSRPVVSYAVGTHGLANSCAPSVQLARGTDYETANIVAALNAGYAVLVTDYQGYTNGATPTYLAGASQGHAVLDIFTAASQIPSSGVSLSAKATIWGYSQGGQSSAWAAELAPTYAKSVKLVGVAAGGVPADFVTTANYLDGKAGSSFLLQGVVGLAQQYPTQIPLNTLANTAGKTAIAVAKGQCVFESLFAYMNDPLSKYTTGNQSLTQLLGNTTIKSVLTAQNLGTKRASAPMYLYHGVDDEFIPLDQSVALKRKYCGKFSNVTFGVYPSEHIVTQFQAAPTVVSWLGDRFAGKITTGTCTSFAKVPTSTAAPGGGDFIVSLRNWEVGGTVDLAGPLSVMSVPAGSRLTAQTNLTKGTLTGDITIPPFQADLKLSGLLPIIAQVELQPTAPLSGTARLDNDGLLHVRGKWLANIKLSSLGNKLSIPAGCVTNNPVEFRLNFDGPLSSLGNGQLLFAGTTSFPELKDCWIDGTLEFFFSKTGQKFEFSAKPPAPTRW
jgi:pimeloyl-ACP methyl ester carboxylesterase